MRRESTFSSLFFLPQFIQKNLVIFKKIYSTKSLREIKFKELSTPSDIGKIRYIYRGDFGKYFRATEKIP